MEKESKIYVAGHRGMVGSAIVRKLQTEGYNNLVLRTLSELYLAVEKFFSTDKSHYVFLAASKEGGIMANKINRTDFLYQIQMMESSVIQQSYFHKAKKLLFLVTLTSTLNLPHNL